MCAGAVWRRMAAWSGPSATTATTRATRTCASWALRSRWQRCWLSLRLSRRGCRTATRLLPF
eukprot:1009045-Heterocapsa_arctica.AAC.1